MPPAHLNGQSRTCGAATVVVEQDFVRVGGELWAVENDLDDHGSGQLIPTYSGITINGKPVIVHTPDAAMPDDLCIPLGGAHCDPETASGSDFVYAYGGP